MILQIHEEGKHAARLHEEWTRTMMMIHYITFCEQEELQRHPTELQRHPTELQRHPTERQRHPTELQHHPTKLQRPHS